ncbi:hypothetical protein [Arthrobacter sp. FW306-06-A]|uniref:hypothetical protein n=1 Tax=Arthrobacter sp. FW306-06-A TaxID=2879621 RepID=UPI001F36C210|nr:hypothetical protein [Arthrobacter sp. FW306-06-A]UKA72931.1 hypothetical protein LFT49_09520 [Arthrobacter sp. FW306-06-A]
MENRITLMATLASLVLSASACAPSSTAPTATAPAASAPATTSTAVASSAPVGWGLNPKGAADRIKAAGLQVLNAEGAAEHFHAHLDIFTDSKPVTVPADIGFSFNPAGQPNGISALHSHDETGIIHIEAPTAGATYTLGQFLTEWGVLDGTDKTPGTPHSNIDGWNVAVNGTKRDGKITDVVLKAHDEIVLFHGTAPNPLPASYTFTGGL